MHIVFSILFWLIALVKTLQKNSTCSVHFTSIFQKLVPHLKHFSKFEKLVQHFKHVKYF